MDFTFADFRAVALGLTLMIAPAVVGAAQEAGVVFSATAPSAPTADEMIAAIKAVPMPQYDPARQGDAAYVKQAVADINAANAEQMRRRLAFVKAYPTHKWAAGSMMEAVRAAGQLGDPPLQELGEELLALPLAKDTRVMLRIRLAEAMSSGSAQGAAAPDPAGAAAQLDALRRENPGDERVAFLAFSLADDSNNPDQLRAVVAEFPGTLPAKMAAGQLRRIEGIGKPFELAFDDLVTGRRVDVQKDLQGKVVVIDFWATWCGPCVADLPNLQAIYAKYRDKSVEFIGVSLDRPEDGGREKLLAFLSEHQVPWPQYYQGAGWEGDFSSSWGINSVPTLFVIDRAGRLSRIIQSSSLPGVLDQLTAAPAPAPGDADAR